MNELHLFAGAGGGILGGMLLGHTCVCAVEISEYRRKVLLQRQRDGILPRFPVWDDVTTFDGRPWRGIVDVVCGGFPCQDISAAGAGAGIRGERSGLWAENARIIGEVQPQKVFLENSPRLTVRGIDVVLGDLATLGYDARWGMFSSGELGARHERERLFLVADNNKVMVETGTWTERKYGKPSHGANCDGNDPCSCKKIWLEMADRCAGMDHELANWMDRTAAVGDGQDPAVVRLAWETLEG